MESPSSETDSDQQPFSWLPHSKAWRKRLAISLAALFLISLFSGFYTAVFNVVAVFLLISAVRYGYLFLKGELPSLDKKKWWKTPGAIAVGALAILLLFFQPGGARERDLTQEFQAAMEGDKQMLFNWAHPIGDAKSIKVHDVKLEEGSHGRQAAVRFTIYWEGPLTKDGFTKVLGIYDFETGRWVRGEVLETNGTTNAQVLDGITEFIGAALSQ